MTRRAKLLVRIRVPLLLDKQRLLRWVTLSRASAKDYLG